jgi:nucleoid-associated protein YejK
MVTQKNFWYLDGSVIRVLVNHGIIDPARIILNVAIRDNLLPNETTVFPSEMWVDYVRVYSLKNDCNTLLNNCKIDFWTYEEKVKKEIIIGGLNCVNSVPANSKKFLRAQNGVLIKGDFSTPLGSELYIDVNPCY